MNKQTLFQFELGAVEFCLGVCGLTGIWRLSRTKPIDSPKEWLKNVSKETKWTGKPEDLGNFIFSVTSQQLLGKGETNNLVEYLLFHPNTKIVHHYKNNTHGPNVIFVCMHHMYPDQNNIKIKNNIEEHKKLLEWRGNSYFMKEEA
jgi:hypothetical protein